MKTFMGSYLESLPHKYGEKDRLIWSRREVALRRNEICFLGNQKGRSVLGLSLSVPFHCKSVRTVSVSAQSSENQALFENEDIPIKTTDKPRTVRVRFTLNKKCAFGQHFLLVGDDPGLGFWDPSDGIPFTWSDGHVWTAELDVPCGKMIKYKFILKEDDNTISWQPGPDRVLETWNTEKTIIVFDDWDNPEFQDILEEDPLVSDLKEGSLINSESHMVAENLTQTVIKDNSFMSKQPADSNDHASLEDKNIEDNCKQDLSTSKHYTKHESVPVNVDKSSQGSNLFSPKDEDNLVFEPGVPVLVPGLISVLPDEARGESLKNVEKNNDDENVQEVKSQPIPAQLHSPEPSEAMAGKEQELYGKESQEILKSDMKWGRRMLRKLLSVLGFSFTIK